MKKYIKLLRPKHWIKNCLIFFPVIFYGSENVDDYLTALIGLISFSALASSIYIFNDIHDKDKDRLHVTKSKRPIASGEISVKNGAIIGIILFMVSLMISVLIGIQSAVVLEIIYFMINIAYSWGLKDKTIVDVLILAAGFVLRVLYGGFITNILVSEMLLLTVCMFSLYMGLGKRRNEKRKVQKNTREVLQLYTDNFLDKNMYMCLTLGIVFYSIWAISLKQFMVYTTVLVVVICMRYNYILESESLGDPVEVLFADKLLLGLIFLFGVVLLGVLFVI